MDLAKRTERVKAGIKAQKLIKAECERSGDKVGAKAAQRKIKEYEKELENLGRQA